MTGCYHKLAISKENMKNYDEAISFLLNMKEIVYNTSIDGSWKPFQTGVLIATETAIDFQRVYLENYNFKYVFLSRLTQGCLENVFSVIRARHTIPNGLLLNVSLRLLSVAV